MININNEKETINFIKVIKLKLVNSYANKGTAFYELKKYKKAIINFTKALNLTSNVELQTLMYANRGSAFYELKKYKKAIIDFKKALKLTLNVELQPKLYYLIAISYRKQRREDKAYYYFISYVFMDQYVKRKQKTDLLKIL